MRWILILMLACSGCVGYQITWGPMPYLEEERGGEGRERYLPNPIFVKFLDIQY
jgi:hypothetical protein